MKELILDGSGWNKPDDLYDAFFHAVGAPPWHGRNFNALIDSIGTGQINAIEVPYRIVIRNYDRIGSGAMKATADFVSLIEELMVRSCPVEIRTEPSN
jgi:RNAse (barnase) inhibitor barstar